jgi:LysM repeat protein
MRSALVLSALSLAQLGAAQTYIVDPPTEAPADTTTWCTNWHVAAAGDVCEDIASTYWISVDQLLSYNPSLGKDCKYTEGLSYCVEENWSAPLPITTTSTTSSAASSSSSILTPKPTQTGGMADGCYKFYFVEETDTCETVLSKNGLTIAQLYALNPGVGPSCGGMWLKVYLCVAGPAASSLPPTVTATTSAGIPTGTNGIATPTPVQPPSIVNNCNKFQFVTPGSSCTEVLDAAGLTISQLFAWNSGVKSDCSGLQAGVYVCVGVIGGATTTSKPTSTSTGGNGITTPTPVQPPSIVNNCNKFHFVQPGSSCSDVLGANGLTIGQLFAWNSGVKSDCSGLQASVYVCVGVIGGATTTSKPTSTSTSGNGITTPTPVQPPSIVGNCNKFHFVQPGSGCSDVLNANGISLAQLFAWNSGVKSDCSGMQASVYVCVGVIGGGGASSTTSKPTTSTSGNGIATPSPVQPPSIVNNCNKFHFVQPGSGCSDVLNANGISLAQLFAWNSGVKSDCSGMQASVYVCVGVIGGSQPTRTTTTSTTTRGNGVATPTPTQPGMVTNCKTFYKVVSGDDCTKISSKTKVSVDNLKKWNTQLGSSCSPWLDYYICIAVL